MTDYSLIFGVVIIIVVILAAIVFLIYKRKQRNTPVNVESKDIARPLPGSPEPHAPAGTEKKQTSLQEEVSRKAGPVPPVIDHARVKDGELTGGKKDITESLLALVEKYSLDQVTLATEDGLVFAYSDPETAQNDAAFCGELYVNRKKPGAPGIFLFRLVHKNSGLIGIIRAKKPVPDKALPQIEADTKDILNFWI